jgi:hypothetical protein
VKDALPLLILRVARDIILAVKADDVQLIGDVRCPGYLARVVGAQAEDEFSAVFRKQRQDDVLELMERRLAALMNVDELRGSTILRCRASLTPVLQVRS